MKRNDSNSSFSGPQKRSVSFKSVILANVNKHIMTNRLYVK